MSVELTIFRTGGVRLTNATFFPWLDAPEKDELIDIPVWSALIRSPEGLIVFDTGLHPVHVERPDATYGPRPTMQITMSADDAIVLRLAALGVRPDDVTIVVNSHLHFDHAGNNRAFPNATFIVQAEHFAYAKGKPSFPAVYWDDPALRYMPVGGRAKVNLERGEATAQDGAAAKSSLALIRSLVHDDLDRAFPSHDAAAFATWRRTAYA